MVKLICTDEDNRPEYVKKNRAWIGKSAASGALICSVGIILSQSLFTGPFPYMDGTPFFWTGIICSVVMGTLTFMGLIFGQSEMLTLSQQKKFCQKYEMHRMGCLDIRVEITPDCDYICFVHHGYTIKVKLPDGFSYDLKGRGSDIIIDMNKMLIYDK